MEIFLDDWTLVLASHLFDERQESNRLPNKVSTAWEEGHRSSHIRQIVEVSLAGRIADAVIAMADESDALQSLRRIAGNSMDLQHRTQSQGKDHLWELELCDLLRRRGITADLVDPPDLQASIGGAAIPIACKKVYSEKGVEAQMRKGVRQIEARGEGGIVAMNIDDLMPEDGLLNQPDHEAASVWLGDFVMSFISRHQRHFERFVAAGRCDGIFVSASCVCDLAHGGPRFTTVTDATLWTLGSLPVRARSRVELLRDAMIPA
ncbi:hypothetical protein [Janthinobacterium sp. DSP2-3-3]|uniref:hypothetical protein n=1 Tax=Janthinobacterium sp. DSP2-3-3 TaxID=2804596 RepID=UPI003CFB9E1D